MRRGTLGIAAVFIVVLVGVHLASAAPLVYKDCIANKGADGCTQPAHDSLRGALGVAVSPDDRSVYVASILGNSVSRFKRSTSGALRYAGCIASKPDNGCSSLPKYLMWGAADIAISPDGSSLYVASFIGSTIEIFDRSPSGALTYRGCFENGGSYGCMEPSHRTLDGVGDVAVSPDGKSVYATSEPFGNSITTFKRSPDGSLTDAGCFSNRGAHGCRRPAHNSLDFIGDVAVSPDGKSVYVTSGDSLTRFKRGVTGALTYAGCYARHGAHGCRKLRHGPLLGAGAVTVSPDGKSVYAVGLHDTLMRFKRQPAGALQFRGCIQDRGHAGCRRPRHRSLRGLSDVTVSPDAKSVYAASGRSNSLTRFRRSASGALHYAGCIANQGRHGCARPRHNSLDGASGVAVSSQGDSVYVASSVGDSVSRFKSR
jgi:DNA-binding beta-propeller fold protein YncE